MEILKNRVKKAVGFVSVIIICNLFVWGCMMEQTDELTKPDISQNKENETALKRPQKKNGMEWLSGEVQSCRASDWAKTIGENEQYIFVLTIEDSILKIDKDTNESICIVMAKKENMITFLYVYNEELYYVMNDKEIYQYNLATEKTRQIYATKKNTDIIFGMQIYKNNIYLYETGLVVCKLDLKTNKKKKLVENVSSAAFHNNKLYYIKKGDKKAIRCQNLDLGNDNIVRKLENKEKKSYIELFTYRDQLCYVVRGRQRQICILKEHGEDSLLLSLKKDQVWCSDIADTFNRIICYDEECLYYVYTQEAQSYLSCYAEGENLKAIKLPEDFIEGGYVCNGYLFYGTGHIDSESGYYINKCVSLNS